MKKIPLHLINKLRQEKLKQLIIEYNRKPQAYKDITNIKIFIDENLPPYLKIQNNPNIKNKRFLNKQTVNKNLK